MKRRGEEVLRGLLFGATLFHGRGGIYRPGRSGKVERPVAVLERRRPVEADETVVRIHVERILVDGVQFLDPEEVLERGRVHRKVPREDFLCLLRLWFRRAVLRLQRHSPHKHANDEDEKVSGHTLRMTRVGFPPLQRRRRDGDRSRGWSRSARWRRR